MKEIATRKKPVSRIFKKLLLAAQSSSLLPSGLRVKLLKMGGVHIKDAFIGHHVGFDGIHPELISIGNHTCVTTGCQIITHFFSPEDNVFYLGNVKIGDKVFMGMNTLIVAPVTIGDGAVLAAGSVVTKDIPPYEIWGGVPARFIKKRILKKGGDS